MNKEGFDWKLYFFHKIGNEKWDLKLKGVCNVNKECEENPTEKCPAEGEISASLLLW